MSEIIKDKKSVKLEGLEVFGAQLAANMIEVDDASELPNEEKSYTYVCSLSQKNTAKTGLAELKWAYSNVGYNRNATVLTFEKLNEVQFDNNLDSMTDYSDGVGAHVIICFALIHFVKTHFKKEKVYFVCADDETLVYV